ncbi:DUF4125 family protein [Aminipila luticellarii]|uniref:DUF4125 family protein n=1 Tax=Aminipila luticellarii TaxID=2507160 RepID=A0A410PVS1_9FIRM|nr:DUF4125 family protein [Aminipila luticellarii]QAT43039.1 DUF4125 family protein [Aminipila luticellarii]
MFGFKDEEERLKAVEDIIQKEWDMFQKVHNIGGRAGCQDDWNTFHIMRFSQYSAWNDFMIKSYANDTEEAISHGRNLVMEKYAFMMEFTDPLYYKRELESHMPVLDLEAMNMVEEISWYMVDCEKELADQYPKLARAGRPIEAGGDASGFTSVETYAKGELKTYSKNTLKLYLDYVRENRAAGKNLALMVRDTMVKMYGYRSIEDAENKL